MKFVRQSICTVLCGLALLGSGCQLDEEVRVSASSASASISEKDIALIRDVSDKIAKEFNLIPATRSQIEAHNARVGKLGGEAIVLYNLPDNDQESIMGVERYVGAGKYHGLVSVNATLRRPGPQILRRMEQGLNERLGANRAKLVRYWYLPF